MKQNQDAHTHKKENKMDDLKALMDKRNSLLFWFPKVKGLGIPTPKTRWVEFPSSLARGILNRVENDVKDFEPYLEKMKTEAKLIEYPVFIRTDMASAKHAWKKAAFVRHEGKLFDHILETIEFNEMAGMLGLNYKAIVIREFLELDWRFKFSYGEMPVAKERRYFIKDGAVLCHHPYWIKEAILNDHKNDGTRSLLGYFPHMLPNTWEKMLEEINTETSEEITLLSSYALKVAKVFDGYWSVDFACKRDGEWVLIDMALGRASYHVKNCKYA